MATLIHYKDKEGHDKIVEAKDIFSEIMMNVIGIKDQYEAWELMYQNQVDDYKTPEGERVTALKVEWLTKLPKILCMQFNRVQYEGGNAVKINQ